MSQNYPETIPFEADGKIHEARVTTPVVAGNVTANAMIREHNGRRFQICISFGTGGFTARPIIETPAL